MDKRQYKEHLGRLQVLFQSREWQDYLQELEIIYRNSDSVVHSVNTPNRELFVGKCLAIEEIRQIEDKVEKELR